jgi:predicted DNA-binding transcriptional regulator YafY
MDRFDRIFKLHNILRSRKTPISTAVLKEKLQCSRATVARSVEAMRDYLGAPIDYDRNRNGYSYDPKNGEHPYELPGLWFSAEELQGLLVCQHLLDNIGPGLLHEQIKHLQSRIEKLLSQHPEAAKPRLDNIKILTVGSRHLKDDSHYLRAATALFSGKRLHIDYQSRSNDEYTSREISPQNLIFYRDNWYMDAWCHLRDELRIFAVDKIAASNMLDTDAHNLPKEQLQHYFASSYGIFPGEAKHTTILIFSAGRACWVADE